MEQIADLTDYQLAEIYFRPDQHQQLEASGPGVCQDGQTIYYRVWSQRGLSEDEIKAKWQADYPNEPWKGQAPDRAPGSEQ